MSMEAFGVYSLRPTSAPCPKPCWGLGLPPQGGHSEKKESPSACCPSPRVCASSSLEPTCLPSPQRVLYAALLTASFPFPCPLSLSLWLCFFIFQKISSRKGKGAKKKAQEIPV